MNFDDFCSDILTHARACSAQSQTKLPAGHDDQRALQILAACAVVMRDNGPQWCLAHPKQFRAKVATDLGPWIQIALALAGIFGGPWGALLSFILPAVLDWLSIAKAEHFVGFGNDAFETLAAEAEAAREGAKSRR